MPLPNNLHFTVGPMVLPVTDYFKAALSQYPQVKGTVVKLVALSTVNIVLNPTGSIFNQFYPPPTATGSFTSERLLGEQLAFIVQLGLPTSYQSTYGKLYFALMEQAATTQDIKARHICIMDWMQQIWTTHGRSMTNNAGIEFAAAQKWLEDRKKGIANLEQLQTRAETILTETLQLDKAALADLVRCYYGPAY